jgi:hypothetical protein
MDKTYNQQQYMRANIRRTKCRTCKKQIIWMRTLQGRTIAVDPMKLINNDPNVRILDEEGILLLDCGRKIGWRVHECQQPERKLGGMVGERMAAQ